LGSDAFERRLAKETAGGFVPKKETRDAWGTSMSHGGEIVRRGRNTLRHAKKRGG